MINDRLTPLREAIGEIDRALLELLRRRMELAAEVGKLKAEVAAPVVVRDVEDRILSRARQQAELVGVSESVMESIFEAILRGSVECQHRIGVDRRRERGEPLLVLGGAGGMGSWLRHFLELVGHRVDVVDPSFGALPDAAGCYTSLDAVGDEALNEYAAIFVSVPLAATPEVLEQVIARKPRGLVVEIASIKSHLGGTLERARKAGVELAALHPMFGPGKSPYEPLTFVLASQGDPDEERSRLAALLRHPYTRLVTVPFEHHDRLMGWLLGLAHLSGMLFGAALTRSGLSPRELRACASTTFLRQSSTALSVLAEDPDLYLDIQYFNPHRSEVYAAVGAALHELVALVSEHDREGFREALTAARRALQEEG
jgi:chorismate mutase / prephenate dehydrogenase